MFLKDYLKIQICLSFFNRGWFIDKAMMYSWNNTNEWLLWNNENPVFSIVKISGKFLSESFHLVNFLAVKVSGNSDILYH